jgi:hypothetical protein
LSGEKSAMSFSIDDLRRRDFAGFVAVQELALHRGQIPNACGIYVALRIASSTPSFLSKSPAGWLKGEDPTRPVSVLQRKWVPGAGVIYIGKAGPSSRRTLRRRLSEFLDFGAGLPKAHRGGSATWQLADAQDLVIAWKSTGTSDPREAEKALLGEFREHYGALPYANFQA